MVSAIKQIKYVQLLIKNTQANVITIQETKFNQKLWYLLIKDHRGELIENILLNSNHITLNTNTPTFLPLKHNHLLHQKSLLLQKTCYYLEDHPLPHIDSFIFTHQPQYFSQYQNNLLSHH